MELKISKKKLQTMTSHMDNCERTSEEWESSKRRPTNSNRRIMTSAIDNMSVAEVRKFLGECRKKLTMQTLSHPMFVTDVLSNGMQVQEFALKFQQGHHQKRHNKNRKATQTEDGDTSSDDDYYDLYTSESENDTTSPHSGSNASTHVPAAVTTITASLSAELQPVIVKKRGRPRKEPKESERTEHHSRSLMDFVKSKKSKH